MLLVVCVTVVLSGYYCPSGTSNPSDFDSLVCPLGSKCPVGSDYPIPCSSGTYQDERGNDTCKTCPAGFYCEDNTSHPSVCPVGSYCPDGSRFSNEFLCPAGTFSNTTSLRSVVDCTPCLSGHYCETPGLTSPTGPCAAGYFCGGGSAVATPHESDPFHFALSYAGDTCVKTSNTTSNDMCPPGACFVSLLFCVWATVYLCVCQSLFVCSFACLFVYVNVCPVFVCLSVL